MLACLLAISLVHQAPVIDRDSYGVPHIHASSPEEAFFQAGYAVAQDRLWQMENSRRLAEGRMAEVFGKQYANSDREVLLNGYTNDEIKGQFDRLSTKAHQAVEAYAKGVNAYIDEATKNNSLPKGYADNGFKPEPWTPEDSCAITIRMFQLFGRSAAGQLRDLALLQYLQARPEFKPHALDIFDDLLWQNDPRSPVTVKPSDDPIAKTHYRFPTLTRKTTEAQLARVPKVGLFELLPGVALSSLEQSKLVAERLGVPYRTGSYAAVVSSKRSLDGRPLLLSGPQMGFTEPAVTHEMSIEAPGLQVVGMDIPGAPGVAVGYTPSVAWGITTGVAFVEDIVFVKADGPDGYLYGGKRVPLIKIERTLKVKGEPDRTITQWRTQHGPVVIRSSSGYLFARHAATWMRELETLDAFYSLYSAQNSEQVQQAMLGASMNFNFFYATEQGDIGYRYLGRIPARAVGLDPRLPVPGEPATEWTGMIPTDQLPHVQNPKSGFLCNWNNKPAAWWDNGDTPVWGRVFHSSLLEAALDKPKLTPQDLELAAWTIAREDASFPAFRPMYPGAYDGLSLDGSIQASKFNAWVARLRHELFDKVVGGLMSPDTFALALQPSVMLNALDGKTKMNYLGGRKPSQIASQSFEEGLKDLSSRMGPSESDWRYKAGGIKVDGQPPIPYGNRGSYIQVVELLSRITGRNVLPPGVAESGPHSRDQAPLSRAWIYKPMTVFGK